MAIRSLSKTQPGADPQPNHMVKFRLLSRRGCNVNRTHNPSARLMFIGEGPGQSEDELGRPFVGKAGRLLSSLISEGMGLRRDEVYLSNIIRCRPPGNRDPEPGEISNCVEYLKAEIDIMKPEFVCLLGKPAAQALLNTALPMTQLRGKWFRCNGIPAIATWHPAYVLRNPMAIGDTQNDLQLIMKAMGLPDRRWPDFSELST